MMEKYRVLFENYNLAIEEAYDKAFENVKDEDLLKISEDFVETYLNKRLGEWESAPVEGLDGLTPSQLFRRIDDKQKLFDVFILGSKICDKDLPFSFIERLEDFKEEITIKFMELALDKTMLDDPDEVFVSLMAMRLLKKWREDEIVEPMIKLIHSIDSQNEIVIGEIKNFLSTFGEKTITPLIKYFDELDFIPSGNLNEDLVEVLVNCSFKSRCKSGDEKYEELYKCVKSCFNKMENKLLGAMLLGDLGDGRAIPLLRGYAVKHQGKIDTGLYNEIKRSIIKLGGNMDDIEYVPMKV